MNCVFLKNNKRGILLRLFLIMFAATLILLVSGCTSEQEKKDSSKRFEFGKDEMKLSLVLSSDKISIAENLEIILKAKAPADYKIEFESPKNKFGDFVLLGAPDEENVHDPSNKFIEKTLTFEYEPEMTGEFEIPEFSVKYVKEKKDILVKTKPIKVSVVSQIEDIKQAHIRDIPGVMALKKDYFLWYVLGIVASGVLAVLLFVLVIRILKKRSAYRRICMPFFTALKSLKKLETSGKIENGEGDFVCTKASDILREYIENRFSIVALKCTTEEFLLSISDQNLLINNYSDLLEEFLEKCDAVKFAKYDASSEECHHVIQCCRLFILQTKSEEISYNGEFGEIPANQN